MMAASQKINERKLSTLKLSEQKLSELKLLIGHLENPVQREVYPSSTFSSGIPKGLIVELLGPAKTEWLLHFLSENSRPRIFWIEKEQSILPTALQQRGVDLHRITFGLFTKDAALTLRRILQSQLYPIVIAPNLFTEIRVLKNFQMMTEKSNAVLFLFGQSTASTAWPIALQIEIERRLDHGEKKFQLHILRQKYGRLS